MATTVRTARAVVFVLAATRLSADVSITKQFYSNCFKKLDCFVIENNFPFLNNLTFWNSELRVVGKIDTWGWAVAADDDAGGAWAADDDVPTFDVSSFGASALELSSSDMNSTGEYLK